MKIPSVVSLLLCSVLFVPALACHGASPGARASNDAECVVPLSEFCKAREGLCATTFEHEAANVRQQVARGELRSGQIGRCGGYSYVESQGMGSGIDYFDAQGKLVGGRGMGDAPSEWCGEQQFGGAYGLVPACAPVPTETLTFR